MGASFLDDLRIHEELAPMGRSYDIDSLVCRGSPWTLATLDPLFCCR